MNSILGIDLGTSSVKILQYFSDKHIEKATAKYEEVSPHGWWNAICQALSQLNLTTVVGIGLSSQVGTYIINDTEVINWSDGIGEKELAWLKENYERDIFVNEISMPYPNILSYPIGRLKYIKEHYENIETVCQPKDYICEKLTGKRVTDAYSWRGLANLEKEKYSQYFLNEISFPVEKLPAMINFKKRAGFTKEIILDGQVLPDGIPVYVGLNDYYSSLIGMGIENTGDMFDITGTSEHLGIVEKKMSLDTQMVSGPYINEYVHYGVTASSGVSLDFALRLWGKEEINLKNVINGQPPIFLPYLNGERAPIWDADARGMFFGISDNCSKEQLLYAVFEGVVFSLYHIYENMGMPYASSMKIGGGASVNAILNQIKAEMFDIPVMILEEKDAAALGAVIVAAVGGGWYIDEKAAIADLCKVREKIEPIGNYRDWLLKRFEIYKSLYPALKEQYEKLKELRV